MARTAASSRGKTSKKSTPSPTGPLLIPATATPLSADEAKAEAERLKRDYPLVLTEQVSDWKGVVYGSAGDRAKLLSDGHGTVLLLESPKGLKYPALKSSTTYNPN